MENLFGSIGKVSLVINKYQYCPADFGQGFGQLCVGHPRAVTAEVREG